MDAVKTVVSRKDEHYDIDNPVWDYYIGQERVLFEVQSDFENAQWSCVHGMPDQY